MHIYYVPFKLFYSYRDESIGRCGENGNSHLTHPQAGCGLYLNVTAPRARRKPIALKIGRNLHKSPYNTEIYCENYFIDDDDFDGGCNDNGDDNNGLFQFKKLVSS